MTQQLTKPILTLIKDPAANEIQDNPYGFDPIHVWCFNYDGEGSAIATYGDAPDLEDIPSNDLYLLLFGDPGSGVRWYHQASYGPPAERANQPNLGPRTIL